MKLRFASNSLRLRLRKSDIEELRRSGCVCDAIIFCEGNELQYALKLEDVPFINAEYQPGSITVHVPKALAKEWMDTDQVSLRHDQPLYNGFHLDILIEKDFPCRHTSTEDMEDTFYELTTDQATED
ncbi:MAG: DUF7009 family protein [Saprospiraceae bacterium]